MHISFIKSREWTKDSNVQVAVLITQFRMFKRGLQLLESCRFEGKQLSFHILQKK